jgi:hypothetical protein
MIVTTLAAPAAEPLSLAEAKDFCGSRETETMGWLRA